MTTRLEYVWLDGYKTPNLRSKVRYTDTQIRSIDDCVSWGFDGSSTKQAEGSDSDCVLRPVRLYYNSADTVNSSSYLVLCEVDNADGTPHESNFRNKLQHTLSETEQYEMLFGLEQEYVLRNMDDSLCGWPESGLPKPQGEYYCGIGCHNTSMSQFVEEHTRAMMDAGLTVHGTNAEVMLGQWEYQLGPQYALEVADELWISRYLLYKIGERYGVYPDFHPKPMKGDWNGSGCHINFSTEKMRHEWTMPDIHKFCEEFGKYTPDLLEVYGEHNKERLTGEHETSAYGEYSYGASDRGCSVRIPYITMTSGRGYLEDRRPSSNIDPYQAISGLIDSVTVTEKDMVQVDYKV